MMPSVDPKQMAMVQQVSKDITAKITHDHAANTIIIEMSTTNPQAAALIPRLESQMTDMLAMQLQSFFAIQGKIVDKNKPKA